MVVDRNGVTDEGLAPPRATESELPHGGRQEAAEPSLSGPPGTTDPAGASRRGSKKSKRRKKKGGPVTGPPTPPTQPAWRPAWLQLVAALVVLSIAGGIIYFVKVRRAEPRDWAPGDEVAVKITLVAADRSGLACAAPDEVRGKHCAFEAPAKPWSKGSVNDDKSVLKPYTTTDRRNLLAAGLWSEPALMGPLPSGRFSVKCTFSVEALVQKPSARWAVAGPWGEGAASWPAGAVTGCTVENREPSASAPSAQSGPPK